MRSQTAAMDALGWAGAICVIMGGLVPALAQTAARAGTLPSPGCLAGGDSGQVRAVGPAFEIALTDGRTVRLPGIDASTAVDAAMPTVARDALVRWLIGRPVMVHTLAAEPDRWGRTVALLFATAPGAADESSRVSISEALIEAGSVRARPDPLIHPCWASYLAFEQEARAAGTGLWRDARFGVIDATDLDRLRHAVGTLAIVQGRVASVVEGRARTLLRFASGQWGGFTVAVERHATGRLGKGEADLAAWRGRSLRVRGLLDDRFGLQIDVLSTDQIEFTEHG